MALLEYPSLANYLLLDVFFFNPVTDPRISPFFGQSGVRCWKCSGPTRLDYHDQTGPRVVFGY